MKDFKKEVTNQLLSKISINDKKVYHKQKTIIREDNNLYTEEYLVHHGAIFGNKKEFILFLLRSYINNKLLYKGEQNMEGLARFIYQRKILYVHHPNGYKRMKYNSILYVLRANHKREYEEWEKRHSHTNKVTK